MLIVTNAMRQAWPKLLNEPVVATSPGCMLYDKDQAVQTNITKVVHPWHSSEGFSDAFVAIAELYEQTLAHLSDALNSYHQKAHPTIYWETIIGGWLSIFTATIYERYQLLQLAKSAGGTRIRRFGYTKKSLRNELSWRFTTDLASDQWNQIIFQEIAEMLRIDAEEVDESIEYQKPQRANYSNSKRFVTGLLQPFTRRASIAFNQSGLLAPEILKIAGKLRKVPAFTYPDYRFVPLSDFSDLSPHVALDQDDSELLRVMVKMACLCIPTSFLEYYEKLQEFSQEYWPKSVDLVVSATAIYNDDLFKIWTAEQRLAGAKLVLCQHGGCYGISKHSQAEKFETKIADEYVTWGWEGDNITSTLPAARLQHSVDNIKSFRSPKNTILWVWFNNPRFSYWCQSFPVADKIEQYFDFQMGLFEQLGLALKEQVKIKLYPQDYKQHLEDRVEARCPQLLNQIERDIGIEQAMAESRLVICGYNGTTFLESIAADIPTLLYWSLEHFEIRDSCRSLFDVLRTAGIFHDSAESCAKQIEKISDNPQAWWNSDKVKDAVALLRSRFANTQGDVVENWSAFISKETGRNSK